jgi:hypothetical protein
MREVITVKPRADNQIRMPNSHASFRASDPRAMFTTVLTFKMKTTGIAGQNRGHDERKPATPVRARIALVVADLKPDCEWGTWRGVGCKFDTTRY